jgi:putative aldouronate transport system substrate-binding protein
MKLVKCFSLILASLLLAAAPVFAGGQKAGTSGGGAPAGGGTGGGAVSYPLKTDVTVSWWLGLTGNLSPNYANQGDTPFGRGLVERTGVKIEFQHPPAGSGDEQFNLMVADGNLPDIVERNWTAYPGGPEKAIEDGVILRLNDIFEKYCPNITAYLKANPEIDKMIRTDNGSYYCFPFIRGDEILLCSAGLMVRKDWLDDLGLSMPETIDEWHTTLKAFKEKKNASAPFSFEYTSVFMDFIQFPYAYKAERNFYIGDDGKIRYGAIEPGYRDWLTTFAQWYREGLVDPDIITQQFQQVSAKVTGDQTGVTVRSLGGGMGVWTNSARATNPKFQLAGAPVPVLKKGDKATFKINVDNPYGNNNSAAITTSCKNVEIAARLLDWNYSEAGRLFYNFGIEGESYTLVNGLPKYTDAVLNNSKGWPVAQSLAAYVRSTDSGPFIQDGNYFLQYMTLPEQQEAIKVWAGWEGKKYKVPPITPTVEESREFARIMNEINTYRNEMFAKFLLGTESLANWDNFVSTVKRMGIDRAVAIQNAALERYKARN